MDKNERRLILLFSLILVIIPMVVFPNRLGLPLADSSAINMLYELGFYGFVFYLFRRNTTLAAIMVGSAMTLVYRMAVGAVFGLTMIVMYGLNSSIAFSLGMTKYLPGVLLHVIAAPFIMRPVYLQLVNQMVTSKRGRSAKFKDETPAPKTPRDLPTAQVGSPSTERMKRGGRIKKETAEIAGSTSAGSHQGPGNLPEENQFDRSVNYIGESGSVKLALVVDHEGLPLAFFNRSSEDIELWAPLTVILCRNNRSVLHQFGWDGSPDKIDLSAPNFRIILRRIEHITLLILAERDIDETIHIRIAQATDMIRKYMNERYSPAMFARVEEHYVSNS